MRTQTTVIIFLLMASFCQAQNTYTYSQPKETGDGWQPGDLKQLGIDTSRVYQLFSQLHGGDHKIHSVLLVKGNQLIIEEYFNGESSDQPHDLRSATKSIRSILMGIAIDQGFIESVNDPISRYLNLKPEKNPDERKDKITIAHLLTMSSGLDCNDWDKKSKGQEDRVHQKDNWLQYTLDLPMINKPGEVSSYCSMGTVLIAEIISQASGMPIDQFAEKYLFNPLGVTDVRWGHTLDKAVIPSGKRLYMTPRDMAKIGQLVLNGGKWEDQQIVSGNWLVESTSPRTAITGISYGYLWWSIPFKVNESTITSTTATGNGGQYIMILPELDMVAVFTGGAYNSQEDKLPFAIMQDVFLPTFMKGR